MLYSLRGELAHTELMDAYYLAVVECAGVGYGVKTTYQSVAALPKPGNEVFLYTYLYVREDTVELYGFADIEELNCFKMLISVSGVGPKAALSILSATTPEGLAMSIITGDEKALTVAQGIGKKIAQRIILELKDKLAKGQLTASGGETFAGGVTIIPEDKTSEAAAALAVLGYTQSEISAALRGVDMENLSLEDVIRQALKKMVKA